MTRRLGVIRRRGFVGLASLSLAAALALGGAITGCGGDDNNGNPGTADSGSDGATTDTGTVADSGGSADTGTTPRPDSGTGSDTGTMSMPDTGSMTDAQADTAPPLMAAATPTFAPPAGTYDAGQNVTISTSTPSATIFYTTDGTNPTNRSVVFSGPIAVEQDTTLRAFAQAPGFADSAVGSASYKIQIPQGTVVPVSFNPPAGTQNNDFLLSLTTTTPNATICYTTDGSAPGCTPGSCPGTATRYDASAQVRISGSTTNLPNGQEKVQAIACAANATTSAVVSQTYTLQVAAPVFQGPAPGTLAFRGPSYTPTASTSTVGAIGMFTQDPTNPPSCTNGRQVGLPGQFAINPAVGNQAILMVGCKTGYAPSTLSTAQYNIQLNAPSFNPLGNATFFVNKEVDVVDAVNNHGVTNDWVCATTDGSQPTCTASGCGTGAGATGSLQDGQAITTVNTTGTVLNEIACTSPTPAYVNSTVATSGTYTLQLDPIKFTPPTGTPIPVGPGSLSVVASQNNPGGDEPYDFICYTTNGVTVPDCTCTATGQTKANGTSTPALILSGTSAVTVSAIGCLDAGNADKYIPSSVATASYPPAGQTATPTILPAATTQNNDTQIQFVNADTTATVDVCYTTNGSAPTCGGTCTAATAPGATVNGPVLTATATTVRALSCDVSSAKSPSAEVTPHPVYTLIVADASISPNGGPINLGGAVTFSTTTKNAVFHYLTNGNAPDCATSPTIAATGADPGPYTATYKITGTETGGAVKVIACRANYTQSANVASATFTDTVATPTFKFGTGTYDDSLAEQVRVSPGIAGTWLCVGAGAGCGASTNACTGVNVNSVATVTAAGVSTATAAVFSSGLTLNIVACANPNGTVLASSAGTATYTLQTSGLRFVPAAGAQPGPQNISVSLLPSVTLPQGDGTAAVGVTSNTEICVSKTQSAPPQPAPCAGFSNPAWTCATGGGSSGLGAGVSPIIAFADVGVNTTYNAFTCRDGFIYQTGSAAYTFTPYSHTIAMTGAVADFTAAAEQIASADAGSFSYVSWDANNLYVGFDKGAAYASSDYVHFYVGGTTGGTTTADTHKILSPQTLPTGTNALFHVWWKVDNTDQGIDQFTSGAWAATTSTPTVKFNQGSTFVEFSIPRATLGSPTDIHLLGSLWTGAANFGSWPVGTGTPTTDVAWNNYQNEAFGDAFLPNDTNQLNQ